MDNFFKNVAPNDARHLADASRLLFDLRENRLALLKPYAVADEDELLARIAAGSLPEHPAYEHYLSATILADTRETLRTELAHYLNQPADANAGARSHHVELKALIEARYAGVLTQEIQLMQDALILRFDTGLIMELRIASADQYACHWLWGEAELAIDTAPRQHDGPPSHLHDEEGRVRADPITVPGRAPWDNVQALIDALRADPLAQAGR